MNPRTAVIVSLALAAARKAGAFAYRFLNNAPQGENEQRVFHHLNGLVESVVNQLLHRTFSPVPLRVVD